MTTHTRFLMSVSLLVAVLATGCGTQATKPKATTTTTPKKDDHEHEHGTGPHGGIIFDLGKYHGEFKVDHDKKEATVFILGEDEKTSTAVTADKLDISIKTPMFSVEAKPMPAEADPKGKTSRFVGTHEKLGTVQEFEGTVNGLIDGQPSQGEFKEMAEPAPKK